MIRIKFKSLFLLILALSLPAPAAAYAFEVDGIYYYINGNNVTVTNGDNKYTGDVTIPETVTHNGITYSVTSIGNYAFTGCIDLTSVTIPNSVITICEGAFYQCSGLTSATIGNSVTSIGNYAFYQCSGLTSVAIPNSVTSIGQSAFSGCIGLTNATFGNSVTSIGNYAFSGCISLTSVTIPNSVTSIGSSAFTGCSGLTSIDVPNSVTSVGYNAFYGTAWYNNQPDGLVYAGLVVYKYKGTMPGGTYITIREHTREITDHAFSGCIGLTSVTIPNSVTRIGSSAFSGCSGLTSLTIPNSVSSIGQSAFSGCIGLTDLIWDAKKCTSNGDMTTYNIERVTIGNEVEVLPYSFVSGSKITSVNIPNSVTSIKDYAFSSCHGVTSVTIPNSVTAICEGVFQYCSGLTSVSIPNSVTSIGNYAFFQCSGLTNITIPNSVTSICEGVFQYCSGLTSVSIPNSVTSIGNYAFFQCSGLTNITIPNSVTSINDYVFRNCTGLINVKLPKTLKSIGNYAFSGCTSLTSLAIPNSVTTIGDYAFTQSGLTNITIPSSLTDIGQYAFNNCSSLKTATVTSHLTSLGKYAFNDCNALSSFTCMPETPPILDYSSSFGTYNTTSLYVPRSGVENYKTHANWRRFTKIYEFVGYFTVPDVNVSKGKAVVVPVSMTNEADIIGFQTDIYLPEGFEFVKDGADYVVDPSDRMAHDHAIMCNVSDDGALRVLCFSPTNKVISGNEGELFYVTINAPADTVGDFSLCFKNTILTTSNAEELLSPDAYTNINVIPYLPGDANGNGEVSVIDIVTAAQYIIFQNPDPFLFEAADLNNDDQITVTDLALIANLVLYPTMNAPKRVPVLELSEEQIHGNDIQLNVGETRTITITLDNLDEYSAFQMEVKLPNGLTANNFRMANQSGSHSCITSEDKDGMIRALCYSPSLAALDNDEKILLTFDVTATGNIGGNIIMDGIELVTTTCQPVYLDAFAISVNQSSSVNEISSGKSVAQIEYYNLAGQKLAEPTQGMTIVVTTYSDGSRSTQKVVL